MERFVGWRMREGMEGIAEISMGAFFLLAILLLVGGGCHLAWRDGRMVAGEPLERPPGKVPVWCYERRDWFGIGLLILVFGGLAMMTVGGPEREEGLKVRADDIAVSIGFQFFVAGFVLAIMAGRIRMKEWLGLVWKDWPWVILIAPVAVVSAWAVFAGLEAVGYMDLLERLGVRQVQDAVKIMQEEKDLVVLGLMAVAAVLVAPVCEEIIFRGYLYPAAKRLAGPWVAAVASALIFSAAHGNVVALVPLFILGLMLVLLYEWTGSIWAPMAVHFLFNAATVAVQMLIRSGVVELPVTP